MQGNTAAWYNQGTAFWAAHRAKIEGEALATTQPAPASPDGVELP